MTRLLRILSDSECRALIWTGAAAIVAVFGASRF